MLSSMVVTCGTFSGTGRDTPIQRSPLRSGQSYSFTSRSGFTTAHVWAWKKCGNQTSLSKYMKGQRWRQSAGTAFSTFSSSAVMAGFVAALYILHSLLPDLHLNTNTLDHFCGRFAFLLNARCSYTYPYLLTFCTNKQKIVWLWDYSVFF